MSQGGWPFDSYALTARVSPSLLLLAPAALTLGAIWPSLVTTWQSVLAAVGSLGMILLLSQFVRDAGKRAQTDLVARWGNLPTILLLRHGTGADPVALADLHARVARATSVEFPTAEEQRQDPAKFDRICESAVATLRELTRDVAAFPLVAAANATYGFRRNTYGARTAGLALSALSACVSIGALTNSYGYFASAAPPFVFLALLIDVSLFITWSVFVTPAWVREAADDYAAQLLASTLKLPRAARD